MFAKRNYFKKSGSPYRIFFAQVGQRKSAQTYSFWKVPTWAKKVPKMGHFWIPVAVSAPVTRFVAQVAQHLLLGRSRRCCCYCCNYYCCCCCYLGLAGVGSSLSPPSFPRPPPFRPPHPSPPLPLPPEVCTDTAAYIPYSPSAPTNLPLVFITSVLSATP